MNISEKFTDLTVNEQENYSEELLAYIRMHNKSISEFAESITIASLVSILIKKGIVTDDELSDELAFVMNTNHANIETLQENKNTILQLIEYEMEYSNNLKDMHDDLINREGVEMTLTADNFIPDVGDNNSTDIDADTNNSFIE